METQQSSKFWLAVALLLCLASTLGAYFVQTNGGTVTVKDLRWETPSGKLMSALLFVPDNATAKTPAPAIVTSHGWYNNREMQDMNFVEYARRGYVVMSMDMYGHGNSDVLYATQIATRATGMTDAVELIASLPYVDKTRIGVTGHSNGARAANFAVDDDNKKAKPLITAVLLVANDPTYKDADGKYINKFGSRNVGIVAAQYDEFFFRVKQADGSVSAPRDYIKQLTAQSFLHFGTDPVTQETRKSDTMYKQAVNGTDAIRVIYTPVQIHPWNTISESVLASSVDFFQASLGAPNAIPGTNQAWQWKELFNVLGLVGFSIFVLAFAKVLLESTFFSTLKATEPVTAMAAPTGKAKIWLWVSLILGAFVSGYSYLYLFTWAGTIRPPAFLQSPVWFIGVWAVANGLFALLLCVIGWFFFDGKAISLKDRGITISLTNVWKTILLSLAVVIGAFAIVFVADWLLKVDFRLWVIPLKAFSPNMFSIILIYLPFFLIFYVIHSVTVNSFNFVKMGKGDWVNTAVLALFTTLGALVIVVVQYGTFFATGKSFTESMMTPALSNILGIWLFPILIYFPLAVVFDRKLYKVTKNPYLGGLIFALIMTIIACTNTLSQLP